MFIYTLVITVQLISVLLKRKCAAILDSDFDSFVLCIRYFNIFHGEGLFSDVNQMTSHIPIYLANTKSFVDRTPLYYVSVFYTIVKTIDIDVCQLMFKSTGCM